MMLPNDPPNIRPELPTITTVEAPLADSPDTPTVVIADERMGRERGSVGETLGRNRRASAYREAERKLDRYAVLTPFQK